jgi:hypothetical protein
VEDVLAGVGHDLVTDFELRGVDADRFDGAGDVPAGDDGEDGVQQSVQAAGHYLPVGRVHPRSPNPDAYLTRTHLGVRQLPKGQDVVGSVLVIGHGSHAFLLSQAAAAMAVVGVW